MNEMRVDMTTRNEGGQLALLDSIAAEITYYAGALAQNILQIGRCFAQAKEIVPHGEWKAWVEGNTPFEERTVSQYMQVYRRFQGVAVPNIGIGAMVKMLSLPAGEEEAFLQEHQVGEMTVREIGAAVRSWNQGAKAEISEPEAADKPARTEQPAADEGLLDKLRAEQARVYEIQEQYGDLFDQYQAMRAENEELKRQAAETEAFIQAMDARHEAEQADTLDEMSRQAHTEEEPDELTPFLLGVAVSSFIGKCARIPLMRGEFSRMDWNQKRAWVEEIDRVREWLNMASEAVGVVDCEVVHHG